MTKEEFIKRLQKKVDGFSPYIDNLNSKEATIRIKYPNVPIMDNYSEMEWLEIFEVFCERAM